MPLNNGHLNSEEYRAIRKVIGFSQPEIQDFHGLKNIRTIHCWEKGKNTTSATACEKLLNHLAYANDFVQRKLWEQKHYRYQPVVFLTYRDEDDYLYMQVAQNDFYYLSDYKMAIARAYVLALEQGLDAHLVIFNPDDYEIYLEATNGEDMTETRENWARAYYMRFANS
jgi:hypothetical protein